MRQQTWGIWALGGTIALLAVLPVPEFWITQLNYIGLSAMAVLGLVLLTGIGGLTSFGQAAFVGIGAYTSAWLTVHVGLSPWLTLFFGVALTTVSAVILGWLTLRMSGHYLPLATLAWGLSLYYLMGNLDALGKYDGILEVPGLSLLGWQLGQGRVFLVLTWGMVLLSALGMLRLLDSRVGRAMRALKNGSQMAESMGIDTLRFKIGVFVLSAMLASVSGWLYAHFQRAVNPSPFSVHVGIEYLFMAVLGGAGHVWGAVVGATVTKLMADQLQVLLPRLMGTSGSFEIIVFGVLLVLTLKYAPEGIWAFVDRLLPKTPRRVDWQDAAALAQRPKPGVGEVVLQARDLRKTFGGLVAVNAINFEVRAGQIVGLIGPNGAGKSTTFNLITGRARWRR